MSDSEIGDMPTPLVCVLALLPGLLMLPTYLQGHVTVGTRYLDMDLSIRTLYGVNQPVRNVHIDYDPTLYSSVEFSFSKARSFNFNAIAESELTDGSITRLLAQSAGDSFECC